MKKVSREIDVSRLCQAVQRSRLALRKPREVMRDIARQVAGEYYSEEGAKKQVILNLLSMYQSIIGRTLIPHNPRFMLSTFQKSIKPAVSAMQGWTNKEIERIKFAETARRIVTSALYSVGFGKVAIASPADAAHAAWNLQAGDVNFWDIDLDDMVWDMHARKWSEVSFIGHRIRVPLDAVKDSKLYDKARKFLEASNDPIFNAEGGDERISMLARTYLEADGPEFQDMVDLWEIYLPRHRTVLTLAEGQLTGAYAMNTAKMGALREQAWVGPDRGPYHVLGYGMIPGNILPKGPMQDLFNLHSTTNIALRKLVRAIDRLKQVTMVRNGMDADGKSVIEANDGQAIGVQDPSSIVQVVMGGENVQLLTGIANAFKDWFDFLGGNLSLLGGRAPQSRTATQDKMLDENANAGVADLQQTTTDYISDIGRSMCWFWWNHPKKVMKVKHSVPGLSDMEITRRVFPAGANRPNGQPRLLQRNGRFEDLDIAVDPYSLQHSSPQQRFQQLSAVVERIMLPMLQLMVQQGKNIDIDFFLKKAAEYLDQPDLGELVNITEPPQTDEAPASGGQPKMPQNTNREYTRNNVSQRTPQSDSQNLTASMLGTDMGGSPNRNGKTAGAGVG